MRVRQSPIAYCVTTGAPSSREVGALGVPVGCFHRGTYGFVGVHDQSGQEFVAALEVAVDPRRDHVEVTSDGPERERRSAFLGDLPSGLVLDLLPELGAHATGRSPSRRHAASMPGGRAMHWNVSGALDSHVSKVDTALYSERCSHSQEGMMQQEKDSPRRFPSSATYGLTQRMAAVSSRRPRRTLAIW